MQGLPKLDHLFQHVSVVIAGYLAKMENVYTCWHPLQSDGEPDNAACRDTLRNIPGLRHLGYEDQHRSRIHPAVGDIGGASFFGGPGGSLDHSSVLLPPICFGQDVKIRSGSKVVGPVLLGDRAHIDTGVVCKRSIIGRDSRIDAQAVVVDSIIGAGVYIMSHVSTMHQPGLGHGSIIVTDMRMPRQMSEPIRLERAKMGCVIGDGCVIECAVVLHPGTVLLPGTRVPNGTRLESGIYDQAAIDHLSVVPPAYEPDPMDLRLD